MIAGLVKKMLGRTAKQQAVIKGYRAIVAQARQPAFYSVMAVPDTPNGRFDMIGLHAWLTFDHLTAHGAAGADYAQALFDEMFRDMDRSLREMGVGDLSVGKKIRKMAEIFYGACEAYRSGLAAVDEDQGDSLEQALQRNVYATVTTPDKAGKLADYIINYDKQLHDSKLDQLLKGDFPFPALEGPGKHK